MKDNKQDMTCNRCIEEADYFSSDGKRRCKHCWNEDRKNDLWATCMNWKTNIYRCSQEDYDNNDEDY